MNIQLAIRADEDGRPIVMEAVTDDDTYFRKVDATRWQEIIEALGLSDAPRAVIPVCVVRGDWYKRVGGAEER